MPKANPLFSAGARLERAAFRDYLKNKIKKEDLGFSDLKAILTWVKGRQKRYDKRPGGLGK